MTVTRALLFPFRSRLVAAQGELKRLHFLDLLVLIGFLDLDVLEKARLLEIRNQIGHGVGAQRLDERTADAQRYRCHQPDPQAGEFRCENR